MVAQLFAARTAVGRLATNVNQAVTVLHSTGTAPVRLADAVRLTNRAIDRVDAAADRLCRLLPGVGPTCRASELFLPVTAMGVCRGCCCAQRRPGPAHRRRGSENRSTGC